MIEAFITGKAWFAEPWGDAQGEAHSDPRVDAVLQAATMRRCGKGRRVRLFGSAGVLQQIADALMADGEAWLMDGNPDNRSDARACIEAAKRIERAINPPPPTINRAENVEPGAISGSGISEN